MIFELRPMDFKLMHMNFLSHYRKVKENYGPNLFLFLQLNLRETIEQTDSDCLTNDSTILDKNRYYINLFKLQDIMNKYLESSIIVFGVFIIFTLVIYHNVIELDDNSSEGSFIYKFDTSVLDARSEFSSAMTTEFMNIFSDFGREYFWIIVPILLFVFGGIDGRIVAVIILFSFMLVIPLTTLVKDLIDRDRPLVFYGASVNKLPVDESYPSGHASMVSAGAVTALLLLRKSPRQKLISILLVIEAGLVCLSRLYLGVHYPTDLIGGILLGSGVALLVTSAHNMIERLVKFKI